MFDYMTAQEAAEKWEVSLRWVQRLCKENRINGAMNINRVWLIPKEARKPADARKRKRKKTSNSTSTPHSLDKLQSEVFIVSKTILIIEDEKAIQNIIKAFLEDAGYTTVLADDGLEGIEQFHKLSLIHIQMCIRDSP